MDLTIVLPIYNEEKMIGSAIERVIDYMQKHLASYQWQLVIADNASTDRTMEIVKDKADRYPQLKYFHLPQAGKGGAIKQAWLRYPARINIFMDADLSTNLRHLPELIRPLEEKKCDLVIGSRLQRESKTKRTLFRSLLSRIYNLLFKILFRIKITDAQCGFKAVSRQVVETIIPRLKDNQWFFDSELIISTYQHGLTVKEIPVSWKEGERPTTVKASTGWELLKKLILFRLNKLS